MAIISRAPPIPQPLTARQLLAGPKQKRKAQTLDASAEAFVWSAFAADLADQNIELPESADVGIEIAEDGSIFLVCQWIPQEEEGTSDPDSE